MRRHSAAAVGLAALALVAGCGEDFVTGSRRVPATVELRNWADTLVLGEQRPVRVLVRDAQGREIVDARVRWTTAGPAVATRPNGGTASTSFAVATSDSVRLDAAAPGAGTATLVLDDPRFTAPDVTARTAVVVAGVHVVAGPHDTTLTALGDFTPLVARALARRGTGLSSTLEPTTVGGVTWSRRGAGAIQLEGTGDSVRAVAVGTGADTLVATHATCLRGGRCADTVVVRVAQTAVRPIGGFAASRTFRAWALGDPVAPQVLVQDARGNAIAGARLVAAPLTAADSAIVTLDPAQVPATNRLIDGLQLSATDAPASAQTSRSARTARPVPLTPPLVLVARALPRAAALTGPAASAAPAALQAAALIPAAPLTAPALVARGNGTARVLLRALGPDGSLLAADTVAVVVRQIARQVRVLPAQADLTPGDSIPVQVLARDANGHLIADATFQPAMAGAVFRNGRIVVPPTAQPGAATLAVAVTGAAQPSTNPGAPATDPAPDSSRIAVRIPPPVPAGDSTNASGNTLRSVVASTTGAPVANAWVRFVIPAGSLAGGVDSVRTDAQGVATIPWIPPVRAGTYTATAVLLGAPLGADSSGRIVLRRTITVVPGAPSAVELAAAVPARATLGAVLPALVARVRDAHGNAVPQAGLTIVASLDGATGTTLGGTTAVTTGADGVARFETLVGTGAAGARTLRLAVTAGATGVAPLTAPITFDAGAVDAGQSTVALSAATTASGASVTVTVTPRDAAGNPVGPGRTVVVADGSQAPAGRSTFGTGAVTDRGDGSYVATLTGVRVGTPAPVAATVDGLALTAAPTLAVTPGAPDAAQSTLAVATPGLVVGGTSVVTVTVRDAAGNAATGAVPADVAFASSLGTVAGVACTGGACSGVFTAATVGTGPLAATIGGRAVGGSPATLAIAAANAPLAVTVGTASVGGRVGTALTPVTPIVATGGAAPRTWSVSPALPAPMALDPQTGVLTGTPVGYLPPTVYTVTVTDAGQVTAQATFTLRVDAAPDAPTIDAVTAAPGQLTVAFTPPALDGGSPITGYRWSTDGSSWTDVGTASPLVLTGLVDGTTYTVRLRAVNAVGAGAVATGAPATPLAAPGAPTLGTPVPGDGQLTIPFTAGTTGGSAITNYEWSVDGTIWTTPSPAVTASPLVVAPLTNGTGYQIRIRAVNAVGTGAVATAASATPRTVPGAPTVGVVTPGAGQLSVAFTAPTSDGGAPITNYEWSVDGTTWTTPSPASTASPLVATGLTNGTPYTIRLRAVNAAGHGPAASGAPAAPGGAAAAPVIAGVTPGDGQLVVAFTAPNDGGSAIQDYEVSTNGGGAWTALGATASPVTLGSLTNGTTYQVALRAVNGFGSGATSNVVAGTPRTVPGAPTLASVTPAAGQLSVAFTAPASTGGAAITTYEVSLDDGGSWQPRQSGTTASPLVVTGLTNGATHTVRVRAVNAAGAGAASANATATVGGPPTAPQHVLATPGSGSVTVTWTAPADNGGSAITSYTVERLVGASTSWSTVYTGTALTYTDGALTNGTTYTYRVSATNTSGTGPTAASQGATPGTPGAPQSVAVTFNQIDATNQNGTLTWAAPSVTNGATVTGYVVQQSLDGLAWTTLTRAPSATALSQTLGGLTRSTTYQWRIAATSSAGQGAWATFTGTTTGPSERLACVTPGISNSSANSVGVDRCSGLQVGDLLVVPVNIENGSTTAPDSIRQAAGTTGFRLLSTQLNGINQTQVFVKVATAADLSRSTPYQFTWGSNVKSVITLVAYRGVDTTNIHVDVASGTGGPATSPTVTVGTAGEYTLAYFFTMSDVSMGTTTPNVGQWTVSQGIWKNTTAGANNANASAVVTGDVDKVVGGSPLVMPAQTATTSGLGSTDRWHATVLVLKKR